MPLSTLTVVQQISQKTKHRDNISNDSRSTSNNSSRAQEFNIPDALVTVRVAVHRAQSKVSIYNGTWRAKITISPQVLKHSATCRFLSVLQTRDLKFLTHSFFAKNVAKFLLALSLQRSRKGQISC